MFIYTVESPHSLVSHVTVEGPYVTFWQRKDYVAEFIGFPEVNSDLVSVMKNQEDPLHMQFHQTLLFDDDHIHLLLKRSISNYANQFLKLIERTRLANTPEGREKIYTSMLARIASVMRGSQPSPMLQKLIDGFDKVTPFIPAEELDILIAEFLKYTKANRSDPWYKRVLELVLAPISFCAARLFGFGLFGAGMTGFLALAGVEALAQARDKYKYECYRNRSTQSAIEIGSLRYESVQLGAQAAVSTGKQFLSLFKRATWACPREYYVGMVARESRQRLEEEAKAARQRAGIT